MNTPTPEEKRIPRPANPGGIRVWIGRAACSEWLYSRRGPIFAFLVIVGAMEGVLALYYRLGWKPAMEAWSAPAGGDSPLQRIGTFGDSFGAVNALFSGTALAGVAVALYLQDKERREAARSEAESRSLQSELATLNTLIHARTALFEERSIVARRSTDSLNELGTKGCFYEAWDHDLEQHDLRNVQRAEVERLIEASEARIGWQPVPKSYREESRSKHLLGEALSYEQLGNIQVAIGIYGRIITDHASAPEAVKARERLKHFCGGS